MIFETEPMSKAELNQFRQFLNEKIDTCYEINKTEDNRYYVVIFEMTAIEEEMVMEWLAAISKSSFPFPREALTKKPLCYPFLKSPPVFTK